LWRLCLRSRGDARGFQGLLHDLRPLVLLGRDAVGHLVELLAEGAVDVAESFSPEPLSRLTFRRAWQAWRGKVIPWGCLASPLFEPQTAQARFDAEVSDVLDAAQADGGLILGVADQAVEPTLASRVRRVRELLGA